MSSFDDSMSDADAYVLLARHVISMTRFPHELRAWWRDEEEHRIRYALGDAHVAELVECCRLKLAEIDREAQHYAVI